jgi:hypothetical protein
MYTLITITVSKGIFCGNFPSASKIHFYLGSNYEAPDIILLYFAGADLAL